VVAKLAGDLIDAGGLRVMLCSLKDDTELFLNSIATTKGQPLVDEQDHDSAFPHHFKSGMVKSTPTLRSTGERLDKDIVYRGFPKDLGHHGVIVDPDTLKRYRVLGNQRSIPGCNRKVRGGYRMVPRY
jgi:hypothetical protein